MNVIDAALAFAVKSYGKPVPCGTPGAAVATIKEDRPIKVTTPKVKSVKVETTAPKAEPICFVLPAAGTLDAKGFLVAMRRATDRNVKIQVIAAFVGYDVAGDYGSQELAANSAAKRALRPIDASGPNRQEHRAAQRSALGFVNGLPDNHRVKLQDLLGREKMAADQMIEHHKAADAAQDETTRAHHLAMALLEKSRLAEIQGDIHGMVG